MKSLTPAPPRGLLLPVLLGVCGLGAGITGTLLVMEHRASAPNTLPASSVTVSDAPTVPGVTDRRPGPFVAPSTQRAPGEAPSGEAPSGEAPASGDALPPGIDVSDLSTPPADLTQGMTGPQAAATLGNWYYDKGRWHEAATQYQRAIAGGIDNPDVRTDLGSAFRFAGQPQQALQQYRIAQTQDPKHENSLFNQGGVLFFSLHDAPRAIAVWRTFLKRFPGAKNSADVRKLIAQAQKARPVSPR